MFNPKYKMAACTRRKSYAPHATAVATISSLNERCLFWPRSVIDVEDRYTAHIWVERVATGTIVASRSRWPNGLICRSKRTPGTQARKCWARSLRSCLRGDATRHHSTFTSATVIAITPSLHRPVALTSPSNATSGCAGHGHRRRQR